MKKNDSKKNIEIMNNFTLKNIPDLDVCVLAALELFSQEKLPSIKIPYKRPLVVGSGNAAATGEIIFQDYDAVFADESSYENKLKKIKSIDGVVLVSASGGKHAPIIAKKAKKYKKKVTLITNNHEAPARKFADKTYVFPKNREPYTYNTSTYMGMVLGKTHEDAKTILEFVNDKIAKIRFPDLKKFNAFYIILPPKFETMMEMLDKKFVELFGRRIAYTISTSEYIKHATTVVSRPDELFISFGYDNSTWGKHRLNIPLLKDCGHSGVMAISYYVMGKIQKSKPDWFKRNIADYCRKAGKIFGNEINPIVE